MYFDVIFPMQLSEFIKSVNFVSNLKKNEEKKRKNYIFDLKIDFFRWKNIFLIYNKVYSDRSELDLSDEAVRIQKFQFYQKLWWKNNWKLPKLLPCGKAHIASIYVMEAICLYNVAL